MMTTLNRSAAALAVVGCAASIASAQSSQRVESLLSAMTLEEKAGQMVQITIGAMTVEDNPHTQSTELSMDKVRELIVNKHIGSILNTFERDLSPELWRETVGTIQKVATEETRLGSRSSGVSTRSTAPTTSPAPPSSRRTSRWPPRSTRT